MSVTVRHLNADSTFLLIFSPKVEPQPSDLLAANGAYSVLVDPWLTGSSIVNAAWFAITHRVVPSSIQHLSEIEEPDVVLVSQNKPDHCHKETLMQLRPEGKTTFAAEPGAAKAIKSWNHFDPNRVHGMSKYDATARFGNNLRLRIPPLAVAGQPGELNIAFVPAKNYVTGLHNAFGITYQAPTREQTLAPVPTIDLPKCNHFCLPLSPVSLPSETPRLPTSPLPHSPRPRTAGEAIDTNDGMACTFESSPAQGTAQEKSFGKHRPRLSRTTNTQSSDLLWFSDQPAIRSSSEMEDDRHQQPRPSKQQQRFMDLRTDETHKSPNLMSRLGFDSNTPIGTFDFGNPQNPNMFPLSNVPSYSPPTPPDSPKVCIPHSTLPTSPHQQSVSSFSSTSGYDSYNGGTNSTLSTPATSYSPLFTHPQSPHLRYSRPPHVHPARPKAVSVVYTPHGVPLSDLKSYISHHLVPLPGALPLTLLLHSFDFAQNPWWFGGNIMLGAASGVEIAKALLARCWLSAHDEDKDDRGVAVRLLKTERTNVASIQKRLSEVDSDDKKSGTKSRRMKARQEKRWQCEVRSLEVGEDICLNSNTAVVPPSPSIPTAEVAPTSHATSVPTPVLMAREAF